MGIPAFPDLFEGIADALLLMTPRGVMMHMNGAASELLGYRPAEIAGKHVSMLYPPSEEARVQACFDELATRRSTRYPDGVALTRDGATVAVEVVGSRIEFAGGPAVIAVVRDIRERKQAEAELRAAQERFHLLAEHIREIFWVSDPHTRALYYASPAFAEMSALPAGEQPVDLNSWAQAVVPPDRPRFETFLAAQAQGDVAEVEVRVADRHGGVRWLHCRAFPWQAQGGHARVAGVAEDITARKEAEAHRLAQAERQRETLVREAHHRIKNSLQGVVGLLRRCAGQHPALAQALTGAISQVRSIAVIHELQGSQAGAPVQLGEFLRMIAGSIEGLFDARVKLDVRDIGAFELRLADSEAVPLAIVLNELLMNAVKYRRCDRDESVDVELSSRDGSALIVISNCGELPPGFDFAARRGLGQGLELLAALLPTEHATLDYRQLPGRVQTRLSLRPPIITFDETHDHAHIRRHRPATAAG
jgi:PAS domain S-box-containing protein